jgi:predicted PurR-regulated permease PerM
VPTGTDAQSLPGNDDGAASLSAADVSGLAETFAEPGWLRDLGRTSWSLVGLLAVAIAVTWTLGKTSTIVGPVLVGLIVATVAAPLVDWLAAHRVPRAVSALLALVALAAVTVLVVLLVVGGIVAQRSSIAEHAGAATDKAQSWLEQAGIDKDGSTSVSSSLESDVPKIISTLTKGVATGISGLTSLIFAIVFSSFSVFFLLKDGPSIRAALDRHLGVPLPVARTITGETMSSVRRYFAGVTIVALFNGAVVGLGAVILGVPLAGTITVVTVITAYVPFIGAFVAGTFAVVIALGSSGTTTALVMLVIVLLANGLLQNIVQPIAFGATLDLNPLLILIVTIGAGSLFGMAGLVLAAPLTSAIRRIAARLAEARRATGVGVVTPSG